MPPVVRTLLPNLFFALLLCAGMARAAPPIESFFGASVYDVTDKTVAPGDVEYGPGLYAVNRDGSAAIQLAERRGKSLLVAINGFAGHKLLPWNTFMLDQRGAQPVLLAYGWSLPKNRIDFWGRVEKFLDKHIGKAALKE